MATSTLRRNSKCHFLHARFSPFFPLAYATVSLPSPSIVFNKATGFLDLLFFRSKGLYQGLNSASASFAITLRAQEEASLALCPPSLSPFYYSDNLFHIDRDCSAFFESANPENIDREEGEEIHIDEWNEYERSCRNRIDEHLSYLRSHTEKLEEGGIILPSSSREVLATDRVLRVVRERSGDFIPCYHDISHAPARVLGAFVGVSHGTIAAALRPKFVEVLSLFSFSVSVVGLHAAILLLVFCYFPKLFYLLSTHSIFCTSSLAKFLDDVIVDRILCRMGVSSASLSENDSSGDVAARSFFSLFRLPVAMGGSGILSLSLVAAASRFGRLFLFNRAVSSFRDNSLSEEMKEVCCFVLGFNNFSDLLRLLSNYSSAFPAGSLDISPGNVLSAGNLEVLSSKSRLQHLLLRSLHHQQPLAFVYRVRDENPRALSRFVAPLLNLKNVHEGVPSFGPIEVAASVFRPIPTYILPNERLFCSYLLFRFNLFGALSNVPFLSRCPRFERCSLEGSILDHIAGCSFLDRPGITIRHSGLLSSLEFFVRKCPAPVAHEERLAEDRFMDMVAFLPDSPTPAAVDLSCVLPKRRESLRASFVGRAKRKFVRYGALTAALNYRLLPFLLNSSFGTLSAESRLFVKRCFDLTSQSSSLAHAVTMRNLLYKKFASQIIRASGRRVMRFCFL